MKSTIHELKSFYLIAASLYFPNKIVPTSITSVRSKTNGAFIKLQKLLEEENIDANSYIGFIFQIAETMPTPNSLRREDYVGQYKYQFGIGEF
jgi:hypothetical protein